MRALPCERQLRCNRRRGGSASADIPPSATGGLQEVLSRGVASAVQREPGQRAPLCCSSCDASRNCHRRGAAGLRTACGIFLRIHRASLPAAHHVHPCCLRVGRRHHDRGRRVGGHPTAAGGHCSAPARRGAVSSEPCCTPRPTAAATLPPLETTNAARRGEFCPMSLSRGKIPARPPPRPLRMLDPACDSARPPTEAARMGFVWQTRPGHYCAPCPVPRWAGSRCTAGGRTLVPWTHPRVCRDLRRPAHAGG